MQLIFREVVVLDLLRTYKGRSVNLERGDKLGTLEKVSTDKISFWPSPQE